MIALYTRMVFKLNIHHAFITIEHLPFVHGNIPTLENPPARAAGLLRAAFARS
jgi:hypothetical protein